MHVFEKILLVITFAHYALSAPSPGEEISPADIMKSLHKICVGETGVDENLIVEANKGAIPNDDKLKCYMKCLQVQVGIMSDDGEVDYDTLTGLMPASDQAAFSKMADGCKSEIGGSNACEIAYSMNVCFKKARPEKYVLA